LIGLKKITKYAENKLNLLRYQDQN
jgi:hypothetical protein